MSLKLLNAAGWEGEEVSDKLESLRPKLSEETSWTRELRESALNVAAMMQGPPRPAIAFSLGIATHIGRDRNDMRQAFE